MRRLRRRQPLAVARPDLLAEALTRIAALEQEQRAARAIVAAVCRARGIALPDLDVTQPLPCLSLVEDRRDSA